jgi:hypothetical protein
MLSLLTDSKPCLTIIYRQGMFSNNNIKSIHIHATSTVSRTYYCVAAKDNTTTEGYFLVFLDKTNLLLNHLKMCPLYGMSYTCQGYSFISVSSPPTILNPAWLAWPHLQPKGEDFSGPEQETEHWKPRPSEPLLGEA